MRFELGLEKPDPRRALTSGLTIGSAYVAGGLIPLAPYMTLATIPVALTASVAVTALALGLSAESRHALRKQPAPQCLPDDADRRNRRGLRDRTCDPVGSYPWRRSHAAVASAQREIEKPRLRSGKPPI
jgi:hypothetical protein